MCQLPMPEHVTQTWASTPENESDCCLSIHCAGRIAHCEGPRPSFACPYIRVSFASASDAKLEEGIKRLATVIRRFQAESAATSHTNGNAAERNGLVVSNGAQRNGDSVNGHHESSQQHGNGRTVQQIVDENEEMSLDAAVHTAADSQPEAC